MILEKKPITMAEVQGIIKDLDERKEIKDYLKEFTQLKKDKADKLAEEIRGLNNPKIKEYDVIKIVDFLPKDKEDLAILVENSLSEEETNAILEIVKKY